MLFEARDAAYTYEAEQVAALTLAHLAVAAGDRVLLVGPSPSGKSTILGVMAGALPGQWGGRLSGHVQWGGSAPLSGAPDACRVSSLLEHPAERWSRATETCAEELHVDLESWGSDPASGRQRMHDLIERFGLASLLDRNPWHLSGGESQRLAIASTLLAHADLYAIDEPLANLDAEWRMSAVDAVLEVPGAASAAVVASVVTEPWHHECFSLRALPVQRVGVPANFATAEPGDRLPSRRLSVRLRAAGYVDDQPVLRNVELEVEPGGVVGVVGRNGRGKTTLFRAIMGMLPVVDGSVEVEGVPEFERLRLFERASHVAYVVQDAARQFAHSTVARELSGHRTARVPRSPQARDAHEAVSAAFGVTHLMRRHPRALSHGERRRVGLASMLSWQRPVVLLDEPTVGLDDAGRAMVESYIRMLAHAGCAVVVASHDPSFLGRVCSSTLAL